VFEVMRLAQAVAGERRRVGRAPFQDYQAWIDAFETISDEIGLVREHVNQFNIKPVFSLLMALDDIGLHWLRNSVDSVRRQIYQSWELCIARTTSPDLNSSRHVKEISAVIGHYSEIDSRIRLAPSDAQGIAGSLNQALNVATGDYVGTLAAGDELSADSLYWFAQAVNDHPDVTMLYSDEDKLGEDGTRLDPHLKPDWNEDLFRAWNYLGHLTVFRRARVCDLGGFRDAHEGAHEWDLSLRMLEQTPNRILHSPHIAYHSRSASASSTQDDLERIWITGKRTLEDALRRKNEDADVLPVANSAHYRCRYNLPSEHPLVSVIVPTHTLSQIRCCLDSLEAKTSYRPYEVVVIDTGTAHREMLDYLEELKSSGQGNVVKYNSPFNLSAVYNSGARSARGDVFCLLDDNIQIIEPLWLEEMVSHALRAGVGAVGAKLLYTEGTVEHGGIILGINGIAGYAHRGAAGDSPGYADRAALVQNFSAVAGACLVIRKNVYSQLGGMDESYPNRGALDLCLRLREAGYRIVWTPHALMYHHLPRPSAGNGAPYGERTTTAEALHLLHGRADQFFGDPAYNRNLSLVAEDFSLAWPPRVGKPWIGDPPPHGVYVALEKLAKFTPVPEDHWTAERLQKMVALEGFAFVASVYRNVLGRAPDPEGLAAHLLQIKLGVPKIVIIRHVIRSTEAATVPHLWRGLDELVRNWPGQKSVWTLLSRRTRWNGNST
jgi:O-antigen biosynthesis protein